MAVPLEQKIAFCEGRINTCLEVFNIYVIVIDIFLASEP